MDLSSAKSVAKYFFSFFVLESVSRIRNVCEDFGDECAFRLFLCINYDCLGRMP